MYCVKCGKEFPDEASYCPYCGDATLTAAKHHNAADPLANYHTPTINRSEEKKPVNGSFVALIISVIGTICTIITLINTKDYRYDKDDYHQNQLMIVLAIIGLLCGIGALIIVLVCRKKYGTFNTVSMVALIIAIIAIGLSLYSIISIIPILSQSYEQLKVKQTAKELDEILRSLN
ncbi:zinc-ribbon domain-containing protein [Ruminococcus sp.]|uniref:zinc-ribbon domain-containing protein n=1 Tax=Ruminococcus sp. TaxID=41978 RepID=UPI00388F22FD